MKNNFYISFGVWLLILPFLGVPIVWRDALVFVSGLVLLLVYFWPTILGKLQTKSKIKKNNPLNPPYLKGETGKETQKEGKEELRFSESSPNLTHPPTPSLNLREGESKTSLNSPLN